VQGWTGEPASARQAPSCHGRRDAGRREQSRRGEDRPGTAEGAPAGGRGLDAAHQPQLQQGARRRPVDGQGFDAVLDERSRHLAGVHAGADVGPVEARLGAPVAADDVGGDAEQPGGGVGAGAVVVAAPLEGDQEGRGRLLLPRRSDMVRGFSH
jgi:hypothetical protein